MTPPFKKILIANRGEIAVRICRACREMGIESVAVYSEADADALHVGMADEAVYIGPAPAGDSYLNIPSLLRAAEVTGAEAVHPGYGFLAENPEFARAVAGAGLTWIGPSAETIALLGDKLAAKKLAEDAGVPVVPGYGGADQRVERLVEEADRIGYPVMVKAAAGGGGKGMRVVASSDEIVPALESAAREAQAAFGDRRLFLERALIHPRHIEIQIFGDTAGNVIFLGERECSIQRRHQKVIEESPSPVLTPDLRSRMGEAALRVARAAGYVNAGTVEFLFAGDSFYFLEVNTRIQVEHPVTEMVTGLDLVRMQIDVAAGRPLPVRQMDIDPRGHSVEARLYAEDPSSGFLPATGTLAIFSPPLGPGIRNDVGVAPGSTVTPYYDPILAKLAVHADTREEAVARLRSALAHFSVLGVTTNARFLHWIVETADFTAGRMDTGYVDRCWDPPSDAELPAEVVLLALALDMTRSGSAGGRRGPWNATSGWRLGGAARTYRYKWTGRVIEAVIELSAGGTWHVLSGQSEWEARFHVGDGGRVTVLTANTVITGFAVEGRVGIDISWRGLSYTLSRPDLSASVAGTAGTLSRANLCAPMPGTVVKLLVEPGEAVAPHQALVVMEAMKMEHVIEAPEAGVVRDVYFQEGDMVPAGATLVRLAEQ